MYIYPARRYPELKIVLAHAGGSLYFLESIISALVCPNIFIELSTLLPHAILEILEHVEPDRLMVGTDLPENVDVEFGKILGRSIDDEVKQTILWDTPCNLFGS